MSASVTRDITIVYAGLTLGGTSDYVLDGPFTLELAYDRIEVSFHVFLNNDTSEADFLTAEAALLLAFRTPRGTINVSLGATNRGGSGFDAQPSISKIGSLADTGQSARYVCSITARRIADLAGQSGRFDSRTELTTPTNSQKVLTLSGQYTSLSTTTALEQYTAAIGAFCSSRLTLFGLTDVEIVQDQVTIHDSNNVADFTRTYKEIINDQSLTLTNDPALKDATLVVTRNEADTGNADLNARRGIEFSADYHVTVDSDVSTNLKSYWDTKIQAKLIQEIRLKAGAGVIVLTSITPRFHVASNEISASITGVLYASSLVEMSIETSDRILFGVVLLPVWDGNPYSKDQQPGLGEWVRTVTITRVTTDYDPGLPGYNNPVDMPHQENFVEIERGKSRSRLYVGVRNASGGVVALLTETVVRVYVRADKPVKLKKSPVATGGTFVVPQTNAGRTATGTAAERLSQVTVTPAPQATPQLPIIIPNFLNRFGTGGGISP